MSQISSEDKKAVLDIVEDVYSRAYSDVVPQGGQGSPLGYLIEILERIEKMPVKDAT